MNATEHLKLINTAFQELLQITPEFVSVKNMDLEFVDVSNSFASILGFEDRSMILGKTVTDLFDDKITCNRLYARDMLVIEGSHHKEAYEELLPTLKGGQVYISFIKFLARDENGKPIGIVSLGHNKTKEYKEKLSFNSEIQSLFAMGPNTLVSMIVDLTTWRIMDSNYRNDIHRFCYALTTVDDFLKLANSISIPDHQSKRYLDALDQNSLINFYNEGKREITFDFPVKEIPDSDIFMIRFKGRILMDPLSNHIMMGIKFSDMNAERKANDQLRKAAERDSMTGLLNHEATLDHINDYLTHEGCDVISAMFMIDADNFKGVNDSYGHQVGDKVLINIANIIKQTFRSNDIVGRVGGDEFMVLMKDCTSLDVVDGKAEELVEALHFSLVDDKGSVNVTCSVGVSMYNGGGKITDQLYYEADAALYKAKASGKHAFAFADDNN